jgi:hypothetical protein
LFLHEKIEFKKPKKKPFHWVFSYFWGPFLLPTLSQVKSEFLLHQVRNAAAEGILTKINTFNEKAAHILNRSGNAEFSR